MTLHEFVVLDAMNIAETRDSWAPEWWTTARTIEEVLADDERFATYPKLTSREIGYILRQLAQSRAMRNERLVYSVGRRHGGARKWRLTSKALETLGA